MPRRDATPQKPPNPAVALDRVGRADLDVAWLEQVHSNRAVCAKPGHCGRGDALWTRRPRLALAIATADCLPVIVAASDRVAAVHAGWRGLAAGVLPAAVQELLHSAPEPARGAGRGLRAWIGPAIGPCCYEVGIDVAEAVVAASSAAALAPEQGRSDRPHLDLAAAARAQLLAAGVASVERIGPCTRCTPQALASYRRDGPGAGRNWTLAWLDP